MVSRTAAALRGVGGSERDIGGVEDEVRARAVRVKFPLPDGLDNLKQPAQWGRRVVPAVSEGGSAPG
eukprot:4247977-Lingulodinium_polyedra.AAC.1